MAPRETSPRSSEGLRRPSPAATSWSSPSGLEPTPLPSSPTHYQLLRHDLPTPFEKRRPGRSTVPGSVVESMLRDYDRLVPRRSPIDPSSFELPRIQDSGSDPGRTGHAQPAGLARRSHVAWEPDSLGGWDVDVVRKARFDITLHFVYGPPGIARIDASRDPGVRQEFGPEYADLPVRRRGSRPTGPGTTPSLGRTSLRSSVGASPARGPPSPIERSDQRENSDSRIHVSVRDDLILMTYFGGNGRDGNAGLPPWTRESARSKWKVELALPELHGSTSTMLVLCVGMYRACSTWQYGVAGSILERHQRRPKTRASSTAGRSTRSSRISDPSGWSDPQGS